jgi:hypothetical protein
MKRTWSYGVPFGVFFWTFGAAGGVSARRNIRTILKKVATSLFQKISKRPSRLANPEVTVITWSGPP